MSKISWIEERDAELEALTETASSLLVGREVVHVVALPHNDACDGANRLRLTLSDGSLVDIDGGYGRYTGHSCDEYVELISIDKVPGERSDR
jgi:hypothetical protein